jgi:hypothetical protein
MEKENELASWLEKTLPRSAGLDDPRAHWPAVPTFDVSCGERRIARRGASVSYRDACLLWTTAHVSTCYDVRAEMPTTWIGDG